MTLGRTEHAALSCGSYGARWFVLRTHWRAERQVVGRLQDQGFRAFCPELMEEATRRGKRSVEQVPLFPRYVFVSFDREVDRWRPIVSTVGVERLFGATPERPTPVPRGVIERLLEAADVAVGKVDQPANLLDEVLTLVDGPFTEYAGVCVWSSDDRVKVLLRLMGGERTVEVARSQVRVVAAHVK